MRRRRTLLTFLLLVVLVGGVLAGLAVLAKREPADYLAAVPARPDDGEAAARVVQQSSDFRTNLRIKPEWAATFTADDLNAVLRDQFSDRTEVYGTTLSSPRVVGRGDKLMLAARLGDGPFSTVLNLEVRAWLVGPLTDTIAVELGGLKAGGLPVGSHWLMDRIADAVREFNCEVTWYRHEGRPVGLFRLYADQSRPATQLRAVTIADGAVTLAGRSQTTEAGVMGR
jgi:hypothetical protein